MKNNNIHRLYVAFLLSDSELAMNETALSWNLYVRFSFLQNEITSHETLVACFRTTYLCQSKVYSHANFVPPSIEDIVVFMLKKPPSVN